MALTALKRLFSGAKPIIALIVLILTALGMLSDAIHGSTNLDTLFTTLLIINVLAIILLVGLIIKNLYGLLRSLKRNITGSRLTARLVLLFALMSFIPVSVVYYFSLDFLKQGIDSWFSVRVEGALDDALELSKASLNIRKRELLRQTKQISKEFNHIPDALTALSINDIRINLGASELTLFNSKGNIIASSSDESSKLIPAELDETIQTYLSRDNDYVGIEPLRDGSIYVIRVAILIPSADPVGEPRILQSTFNITERINNLAKSVQESYTVYRERVYFRESLKISFIFTLSLVLLLSILMAIWVAFYFADRLVQPIRDLVDGTQAVAEGDYRKKLPVPGKDELGFLVRSFNQMTQKIAMVTDEANRSQQQLAEQHAYLEVVLTNLSSGVITLDQDRRIHTCNAAASQILGLQLEPYEGFSLNKLTHEQPQTLLFIDMILSHLDSQDMDWQEEITFFNATGRQVLLCRGSSLPEVDKSSEGSGYIIVFDDITNLVQAQRNAAWGEVARRLAHEIKNPLTPIQLSAERLRHKYLDKMPTKDAELLDRSTHTIIQQVETLKEMVKAFSDYARMPNIELQPTDLNAIIMEVSDLYRNNDYRCPIKLNLDEATPEIDADDGRIRQLLHNLIKNALEAMHEQSEPWLEISTRCMEKEACKFVELRINDNGAGIPEELMGELFEPYVTTKPKGSGLGLAIVKKIIEEHGGMIWAENNELGGASIVIRLPVNKDQQQNLNIDILNRTGNSDAAA
jgi:PAS domain S-box-containing protein